MPSRVTVYVRENCHLCTAVLQAARKTLEAYPAVAIEVRDVDAAETPWNDYVRFQSGVPVVLVDGREVCRMRLDEGVLERALGAAG